MKGGIGDNSGNRSLRRLIHAIKIVWGAEPRIALQHLLLLLHISDHPGISQSDLMARSGLGRQQVSRFTMELSYKTRTKQMLGMELITVYADPEDKRIKRYRLTQEGEQVVAHIEAALTY